MKLINKFTQPWQKYLEMHLQSFLGLLSNFNILTENPRQLLVMFHRYLSQFFCANKNGRGEGEVGKCIISSQQPG